jgi:hypothetical protein
MSLRGPVRCRRSVFLAAAHEPAATDLDQDGADVDASEYAGVQGSGSARPGPQLDLLRCEPSRRVLTRSPVRGNGNCSSTSASKLASACTVWYQNAMQAVTGQADPRGRRPPTGI